MRTTAAAVNPFRAGDRVVFAPDARATGLAWSWFDRLRLKPGDAGVVTRIADNSYLYLDGERGGFHWECFQSAKERSA